MLTCLSFMCLKKIIVQHIFKSQILVMKNSIRAGQCLEEYDC